MDRIPRGAVVDTLLVLQGGKTLRLVAREAPATEAELGVEGRALAMHVEDAFGATAVRHAPVADVRALVATHARTPREWLKALDGLARGIAHYRAVAVDPKQFALIVSDPTAPIEARAGAAAALVRLQDHAAENRALLRVVASSCAEPSLRSVMLDLAEAESDESVEAALARASGVRYE